MPSVPMAAVVDLAALWKIVLIALAGGVGVTFVFGIGVLRAESLVAARREGRPGAALVDGAIVAACTLVCLAAVVAGLVAMTSK